MQLYFITLSNLAEKIADNICECSYAQTAKNISNLTVAKRMKHRSATWSEEGSLNLCKIVCLKVSHKLTEMLETISNIVLPENFKERVTDILSAGRVAKKVGKGYSGKISAMPYSNAPLTNSRKSFMNWLKGV